MMTWKLINIIIISIQVVILILGTFYKHISFGMGLGDLIAYGIMYLIFFIHLFLTTIGKDKEISYYRNLSIFFLFLTIWICLEATIWRNSEYRWNGKIFYDNGL